MELSNDLISQFAKLTSNQDRNKTTETIVYGTVTESEGDMYVILDGSDLLTPIITTSDIKSGQRVTVMIKDHTATITGNISSPSVGNDVVDEAKEEITGIVGEIEQNIQKEITLLSEQTDRFYWLVKDGSSATSLELSDEFIKMISNQIIIDAPKVELSGSIAIGDKIEQNNQTLSAFRVATSGNLKIGGASAVIYPGTTRRGIAEITSQGTIYSCSSTDPHTYTQISEGKVQVCTTGYDPDNGYFLDRKIVMENGELYITSYIDDQLTTRKKEIAILGNTIYSNMYDNILFEDNVYVEGIVKATSVSQTSDRTVKENIKYISNANNITSNGITIDDCYRFIKSDLPLATYNYIGQSNEKIGFVLQDILCYTDGTDNKVGQLITSQLQYSKDNNKLTYDTNNLFGVILGAMQAMANEIESLKNELKK